MKGEITLLGTGTCQLEKEKAASSVLVELDNLKLVYDFGRGISQRLAGLGLKQDDINHIVISHFHPDHFSDLIPYLQAASWSKVDPRSTNLNIYGPSGIKILIKKICTLLGDEKLNFKNYKLTVHEINYKEFEIENMSFGFVKLPPADNHGIKFGLGKKTVAVTGDSHFHQQEINFLKNTDIAIIDAGHIQDKDIINLATSTQAKQIVCSHLYRSLNEEKLNNLAKVDGYQGKIIVGNDLMSFSF